MRFVTVLITLKGATVVHLGFGEVLTLVFTVSLTHIACLFLSKRAEAAKNQCRHDDMTSCRFSKNIHFRDGFVLSIEDKEIDDEQQEGDEGKTLELLVVVREDLGLDLLRGEFVKLFLDSFGGCVGVVAAHIDSAAGLCDLTTHVFVQFGNDHIALTVFDEVVRSRHGDG